MTVADEGDNDAIESEEAILVFPAGGQDESCCVSEQHYVESGNEKRYCIFSAVLV